MLTGLGLPVFRLAALTWLQQAESGLAESPLAWPRPTVLEPTRFEPIQLMLTALAPAAFVLAAVVPSDGPMLRGEPMLRWTHAERSLRTARWAEPAPVYSTATGGCAPECPARVHGATRSAGRRTLLASSLNRSTSPVCWRARPAMLSAPRPRRRRRVRRCLRCRSSWRVTEGSEARCGTRHRS